jgi:hypothetical protein
MQLLAIYLILMTICLFSGCAKATSTAANSATTSPPPATAPITNVGPPPAQKNQSELRVGADPYYSNRQKSMFGQDMSQTGLLPVMVYLQNNGVQPLKVVPNIISLEFPNGGEVQAAALPNDLLPLTPPPASPPPETTGQKVGRVAKLTGLVALDLASRGMVSAVSASNERHRQAKPHLQKDYENKELREVTLARGESAQGFVYFYIPQGVQHAVGSHLIVPYLPAQGQGGKVRVPLM